jgi:Zn/Cd-binding protein ZinT
LHGKGVEKKQVEETFQIDSLLEAKSRWVTGYVRSTDTPVKQKRDGSRRKAGGWISVWPSFISTGLDVGFQPKRDNRNDPSGSLEYTVKEKGVKQKMSECHFYGDAVSFRSSSAMETISYISFGMESAREYWA